MFQIHMGCMHGVDSDGKTPVEQHVCHICGNSYGHKLRLMAYWCKVRLILTLSDFQGYYKTIGENSSQDFS
jgi:hypothetical protein